MERLFQQRVQRNAQLGLLLGASTYVLDREGRITFPGVATLALAGLTENQAARRIEAEPSLRPLTAEVMLLPLERFGVDALEPFGYDLFRDLALTFFPATDVPVPADYTLGPGDEVRVQLFGKRNETYNFIVTREGEINFPDTGPVARRRPQLRRAARPHPRARHRADDRRIGERHHGPGPHDPRVRARRRRAAGLLRRHRPVDDDERAVRRRRRVRVRLAPQRRS